MPIETRVPFDSIPTLASLRAEDRAALEPLCRVHGYAKGEVIFREGEDAHRIYFLCYGRVKIVKATGARDVIIEILGPGEPLGTVAAFERRPFPATAIAVEPSGVVSIPEHEFFDLLERKPQIVRHLLAGLTMRLMMVNKRLADMTGSVESRAARLFLTLADRIGTQREGEVFIPLALSRQEIADLVGTTLETAIRLMSRWQKEGVIGTEKEGFTLRDIAALRDVGQA